MDLSDWVIDASRRWLGCIAESYDDGRTRIEPAYSLSGGEMLPTGDGKLGLMNLVPYPLCGLVSAHHIVVDGCQWIPVCSLDEADQKLIAGLVVAAEKLREHMRAQRSGLVVAPANTQVNGQRVTLG